MTQQGQGRHDSFMIRLRERLRERHDRLEQLPFFEALQKKTLPLESYVGLLRALAVIHATLEKNMAESCDVTVRTVWHEGLRKLPLIQRDLAFFEPRGVPDVLPAAEVALALVEEIRLQAHSVSLLGYLYVFEGSTRGSVILRQWLADALSLKPTEGLSYFTNYGEDVQEHWGQFTARMETAVQDPAAQDAIFETASQVYDAMAALFRALYPLSPDALRIVATTLNPEAGRHPVPNDPVELQAALRASDLSWRRLAYYEMRYGERGKRFSDSDSAWLTTLIAYDQETVNQQTQWLARVLSGRGLPRWTMEVHLEVLAEELSKSKPTRIQEYAKLRCAEAALRESRVRHIDDVLAARVSKAFRSEAPADWVEQLPQTVELILSAIADEKEGIANAVESLTAWLTDESRFPADWIAAVRRVVRSARTGLADGQ